MKIYLFILYDKNDKIYLSILSVDDDGYSKNGSCAQKNISTF